MSKLLAGSAIVIGGTGTSLAGVYLMGAFNSGDATLPETVDEFKKGKVGDCVKHYFPGFDVTQVPATDGSGSLTFDLPSGNESDVARSCLAVNWERKNYSQDAGHGKGNFRGLGSFVKGNKGFVMFNVASNATVEKKLDLKGVLYVLERDDTSGKGTSKNSKKNASATKQVTKDDFDTAFPKKGDLIKGEFSPEDRKGGWGFAKKDELESLCKDSNGADSKCKDPSKTENFKGLWTWESSATGGTASSLTTGSSNFDNGFGNLYSGVNLKDKLSSLTGKGNEASVFEKLPKPENTVASQA